jgi:anaerobic selenocysteine-containing dehydrogenase
MPDIRRSVCALDCPDACSLLVTVDGDRATRLRGNPEHPITRGFLCGKVAQYLEREYHPDRLLYPMRRAGAKGEGRLARIGWDEALDAVAGRLAGVAREFGPESILPYSYAGTMGLLNGAGMDRRFFHRLGASRLDRTICATAGAAGMTEALGVRYATEPEQFRHSRLILAWGANVLGTNVHLWPFIMEARRQGAKLYVIDPRRTRTAAAADRHYRVHPGSDTALALAMLHVIIGEDLYDRDYVERHTAGFDGLRLQVRAWTPQRAAELTGVGAEEIAALAREYAATRPAVIRLNYGVQRSERGAMAVRSIAYLPVITGSWKEVGGGLQLSTSQAFPLDRTALERPDLQQRSPLGREARLVNMSLLGEALGPRMAPPVKALVVYNSNPGAIAPDQNAVHAGLAREDLFTVVIEQFQTDTADYADIVLPATTFLEHTDLYGAYGHYYMQLARPALPAPGECRSNVEIFRALAGRMGFDDPCFAETEDEMIDGALGSGHPFLAGVTRQALEQRGFVRLNLPGEGCYQPFAQGGYGFPDGRCHFHAETLDYQPPVESRLGDAELRRAYPLELVCAKHDDAMNSTFGHRDALDRETAAAHLTAADAAARGIRDGDAVRLYNARGAVELTARIGDAVAAGVVSAPSVRWARRSPGRRGVNALVSQRLTDAGGGPVFYSCLVQVERIGNRS